MTPQEAKKLKAGDIVHVKMQYGGKVYLDGDGVFQYLLGEDIQMSSLDSSHYFSGCFACSNVTLVKSQSSTDILEKIKLKLAELQQLIGG